MAAGRVRGRAAKSQVEKGVITKGTEPDALVAQKSGSTKLEMG
jgi:hypothetical protein